jgi:isoquinoline 1-oxidoreductase subunit alpha
MAAATRGCQTTLGEASNATITTIEGLSPDGMHPVQMAWRALNVPQCGFCQAGQIMQAASLLKDTPSPSDQQINDAMYGNICRCGTYPRIRAAIKQAAETMKTTGKGASL